MEPIFFGPHTAAPEWRWDDPEGGYKVCYLGHSPAAAFVETILRQPAVRIVTWKAIEERRLAWIETRRALTLVAFDGPALRVVGATLEVLGTRDYDLTWAWSGAVYTHPEQPDGIYYPCRHDNHEYAIALFDRAQNALNHLQSRPLSDQRAFLGAMASGYEFALI